MKITVLIEDKSNIDSLEAEHGLSFYIETNNRVLLLDTGASEKTLKNAGIIGKNIGKADSVIISHGHYDHSGGLLHVCDKNPNAVVYMRKGADGEFYHGEKYIGIDKCIMELDKLVLTDDFTKISNDICLFSGIKAVEPLPGGNRELTEIKNGIPVQDDFSHEQCLVINENGKSFLFSGCAHNGIINIIERYRELFDSYPDYVISGFHMIKKSGYRDEDIKEIQKTAERLSKMPTVFYTGHCTGDAAFELMKEIMNEKLINFSTGTVIEIN